MELPPAKQSWEPETRKHYNIYKKVMVIEEEDINPLMGTMENYNTFYECKRILKKEGLTFKTKTGQVKVHPLLAVQKNAWNAYLAGLRILGYNHIETVKRPAHRPPRGKY